jgi:hypothetical protein
MNLNYTDIGHFVDQFSKSITYFGFSDQDAQTFSNNLNDQYNIRCAPPVTLNPAAPPELLSLCQNPTCPLAVPVADCAAYQNLTAQGIQSSAPSSVTSAPTSTATQLSTMSTGMSSTTSTPTGTAAAVTSSSSTSLSAGAIAGIAIGGAAVVGLIVGLVLFFMLRKRNAARPVISQPDQFQQTYTGVPGYDQGKHASYTSMGPTISELGSPRVGSPEVTMQHPVDPVELGGGPDRRSQFWIQSQ